MTAGWAVLVVVGSYTLGWWVCWSERAAVTERAAARLRPHGPPMSHVRLIPKTQLFDQEHT